MSDKDKLEEPEFPQISGLEPSDLEQPQIPDVSLLDVELKQTEAPSLDFSLPGQELGKLPGLKEIALDDLDLDFDAGRVARGRPYQPLLVVGQSEEESFLGMPFSVVQLQNGNMYVIDFMDEEGRARVQLFDVAGSFLRTVRQFEVGDEPEALDTPAGIAADAQGNFYITDMGSSCIKKFSPEGTLLKVFGSEGMAEDQLIAPQDVDLDAEGNLYVADTDNNRILKWDQQGNRLLILGINELDEEDDEWLMAGEEEGEFDGPQGVTVDGNGNIFVADTNNHRVQKFDSAGEFLYMFAEEGEDAGGLYYPDDIQVDANGDIYVSDSNGGRIQKFDADGHFVYQIILPSDAGSAGDFEVDDGGHILVALRDAHVVLKLEVI